MAGAPDETSSSQIAHNYFKTSIEADPRYLGFMTLDYNPDFHNLAEVQRDYRNDNPAMTEGYVAGVGYLLAGSSFTAAEQNFEAAYRDYDIPDLLEQGGLVINSQHIHFADVVVNTILAIRTGIKYGVYASPQEAAAHMNEVIARSVDVLGLKLTNGSITENGLRYISNVQRTLPSSERAMNIPGLDSAVRKDHNETFKDIFRRSTKKPGNVAIMSIVGSQEEFLDGGRIYAMQQPSQESSGLLIGKSVLLCLTKCVPTVEGADLIADDNSLVLPLGLRYPESLADVGDMNAELAQAAADNLPSHGYPDLQVVQLTDKEYYPQKAA